MIFLGLISSLNWLLNDTNLFWLIDFHFELATHIRQPSQAPLWRSFWRGCTVFSFHRLISNHVLGFSEWLLLACEHFSWYSIKHSIKESDDKASGNPLCAKFHRTSFKVSLHQSGNNLQKKKKKDLLKWIDLQITIHWNWIIQLWLRDLIRFFNSTGLILCTVENNEIN